MPARRTAYVRSSEALRNAIRPQVEAMLDPPALMNGRVTPVRGRISVTPKTFRQVWNRSKPATAQAAIEKKVERLRVTSLRA